MDAVKNLFIMYDPILLEEFECPVCTEYMHSPIRQCETGHSICEKCFARVQVCPVCRAPRTRARNLALEKVGKRLAFPCKNRDEGCRFIDLGPHILEHESYCLYGAVSCLIKPKSDCPWLGPVSNFIMHCRSRHPDRLFAANEDIITCKDFTKMDEMKVDTFQAIILSDDEVFKCTWHVNYETGLMRWCVFYIGVERSPKNFTYEINIDNFNNANEKLSIRATCKHFKQENNSFAKNLCMFTNYGMLKKFCEADDLKFTVKITRNFFCH